MNGPDLPDLDREACYRALKVRDARFDGRFFTAVTSTGIYCRPVCPARTPKIENCLFLPSAGAAHRLGFRPCLRCRPETAPGSAGWRGTAGTVARALHLIAEGGMEEGGVERLADRLGIGTRHLRRLFDRHVGASPVVVAQTHRLLFAKRLLDETGLSMTDIAMAAGFGSIRRFNDAFQRTYGRSPRDLRRTGSGEVGDAGTITLTLSFIPPYDWATMLAFLGRRAIPGVESVEDGVYRRSFSLSAIPGWVEVRHEAGSDVLAATIRAGAVGILATVVARLRRLFDLDADLKDIDAHLARSPLLARRVAARPGIRVPGAWDDFELAVRAILGQQVSVAAATTIAGRLAERFGRPLPADVAGPPRINRIFPAPGDIASADLKGLGLPGKRAAALGALAAAMARRPGLPSAGETLEEKVAGLRALPGIGAWTAHYIAMRTLREPDAFPAADLGLMRALATPAGRPGRKDLLAIAEDWRPWRAYAAMRLWTQMTP